MKVKSNMISSDNKSKDKDKSVVQDKGRLVQDRDMHIKEANRDFSGDTSNRKFNEDSIKKTVSDLCNQPKKPLSVTKNPALIHIHFIYLQVSIFLHTACQRPHSEPFYLSYLSCNSSTFSQI